MNHSKLSSFTPTKWWKYVRKFYTKSNCRVTIWSKCGAFPLKPNLLKMLIIRTSYAVTLAVSKTKVLLCKTVIILIKFQFSAWLHYHFWIAAYRFLSDNCFIKEIIIKSFSENFILLKRERRRRTRKKSKEFGR